LRYKLKLVARLIKINKQTGEAHLVEFAQTDNGIYAQLASSALRKH